MFVSLSLTPLSLSLVVVIIEVNSLIVWVLSLGYSVFTKFHGRGVIGWEREILCREVVVPEIILPRTQCDVVWSQ